MLTNQEGQRVPKVTFRTRKDNQWVDVTLELKKGALLLKIDGKKHLFESPEFDMADQRQIALLEIGADQGTAIVEHVAAHLPGWSCRVEADLAALPRES